MTDQEFCEIDTAFTGEKIDSVSQLAYIDMTGWELKEYIEFAIKYLEEKKTKKVEI